MSDVPDLRPPTNDKVSEALAHALRFDGWKRYHQADQHQARIAADHLLKCLPQSGFVLMREPPAPMHSDAAHRRPYPLTKPRQAESQVDEQRRHTVVDTEAATT